MPNVDHRTPHGNHPLPHKDNVMSEDVGRIAETFIQMDGDIHENDQRINQLEQAEDAAADILELPTDGQLNAGRAYYLPAGVTVTMPTSPAEDAQVTFVPIGAADGFTADVVFAHPVAGLPVGTHQYNAYRRRTFTFHNGEWS